MNEVVKLSKKDRQDRILTELRVSTTIRISDLAAELGVSYETIRRDLEEMGQSGLINRTYGGAVVRPFGFEPAWNERFNAMTEEREKIAATAAGLIEPREVLMIDAGSTTLHFARRLAAEAKNLTIVTNCFAVAMAFSTNPTITVLSCPGQYDSHEGQRDRTGHARLPRPVQRQPRGDRLQRHHARRAERRPFQRRRGEARDAAALAGAYPADRSFEVRPAQSRGGLPADRRSTAW
jgi:DNA-binding Lrp family transcriptional regulator